MNQLISEYLRPKSFQDMMLPKRLKSRLQQMLDEKNVMNMIFYGKEKNVKLTTLKRNKPLEFEII